MLKGLKSVDRRKRRQTTTIIDERNRQKVAILV